MNWRHILKIWGREVEVGVWLVLVRFVFIWGQNVVLPGCWFFSENWKQEYWSQQTWFLSLQVLFIAHFDRKAQPLCVTELLKREVLKPHVGLLTTSTIRIYLKFLFRISFSELPIVLRKFISVSCFWKLCKVSEKNFVKKLCRERECTSHFDRFFPFFS